MGSPIRGVLIGVPVSLALWVGIIGWARAGLDVPPAPPPDLSGYVTADTMASALSAAASNSSTKLDAVPTTGPGPGKCRFSVVPSNLIQSGGVTGTPGTCSRIVQCGTSGAYVVAQFNIGDGC